MASPITPGPVAMPTLYGALPSRTFRCLWMLEEVGIAYDWVRVTPEQMRSADYLSLNPNGKMPVLRDGSFTLWESIAINLHIARTYGNPPLWPSRPEDQALVLQWSLWAVTELEPHVVAALADPAPDVERYAARLAPALEILDHALRNARFLLGPMLTAADINVAGILGSLLATPVPVAAPHAARWLRQCLGRPYPRQFFGLRDVASARSAAVLPSPAA